jgi:hypothetical protein
LLKLVFRHAFLTQPVLLLLTIFKFHNFFRVLRHQLISPVLKSLHFSSLKIVSFCQIDFSALSLSVLAQNNRVVHIFYGSPIVSLRIFEELSVHLFIGTLDFLIVRMDHEPFKVGILALFILLRAVSVNLLDYIVVFVVRSQISFSFQEFLYPVPLCL